MWNFLMLLCFEVGMSLTSLGIRWFIMYSMWAYYKNVCIILPSNVAWITSAVRWRGHHGLTNYKKF
jgi:hypothetical protein